MGAIEYIGTVAEDKEPDSLELKVFIRELLPGHTGNLIHAEDGKNKNTITALWDNSNPNITLPSNVVTGESVRIRKIPNKDHYTWEPLGLDKDLRSTERVTASYAANDEVHEELTDAQKYITNIDTDTGELSITTSVANKESQPWSIKLDTFKSTAQIQTGNGLTIYAASEVPEVIIELPTGSVFQMVKKDIFVHSKQDIVIKADRQIVLDAPNVSSKNGGGTFTVDANDVSLMGSSSVVVESSCVGLNGTTVCSGILASPDLYSSSYNTSSIGTKYSPSTVNIPEGIPTSPPNDVRSKSFFDGGSIGSRRHCTAWEQVTTMMEVVGEALLILAAYHNAEGSINAKIKEIEALAVKSRMPRNRGE